ncbi:hypothetical protein [Catenulispora rubra]|uniref:hypothetical protein n=1 Tax=Catenulispora rubra TaxID=280293 RepID=UPI00189242B1|nr:hypothetical protein [Catenulispora rubra]
MTRIHFIPFVGIIGISAIALAGCGSSSGTTGSALAPSQSITAAGNSNQSAPTSGGSPGGGWALSAPKSIFGFAQIQPQAATLSQIQSELAKHTAPLGVRGSQIIAVYDDTTHDVYVIFAGYNGSGFKPDNMKPVFTAAPLYTTDGAGDHVVENHVMIDAGPHGGLAGCGSSTIESGGLAAESTDCMWMTATTMGSITYYPKPDHQQMVFGTGPDVMGKVMRDLRNLVEHQS